jgi:hypothetical protein
MNAKGGINILQGEWYQKAISFLATSHLPWERAGECRTSSNHETGGFNQTYGYDLYGNRWVSESSGLSTTDLHEPTVSTNFNAANQLVLQESTFDPAGNKNSSTIEDFPTVGPRSLKREDLCLWNDFLNLLHEVGMAGKHQDLMRGAQLTHCFE